MALRKIRTEDDPILRKECRDVARMNDRTRTLIEDMFETMYEADGVGLAGPQVGVLRKIFVIDIGEEEKQPLVFINPKITEQSGECVEKEGCLSFPGYQGMVKRAEHIKVRALDREMREFELEADGLLARAIQHENDHLYGILYVDKVIGELIDLSKAADEEGQSE